MFCHNCGNKVHENGKYCGGCGEKIVDITSERVEEQKHIITNESSSKDVSKILKDYLSKTEIKNAQEARALLSQTRIWFWSFFLGSCLLRYIGATSDDDTFTIFLIIYFVLLVLFVRYCMRIIKLTAKVSKADAVWSIFLAPVSWLWFYPDLVRPLKIIIGEIQPPTHFQSQQEKSSAEKERNIQFYKTIKQVVIFSALAFLVILVVILMATAR